MVMHTSFSIPLSVWINSQEGYPASRRRASKQEYVTQDAARQTSLESREFFEHIAEVMPIPTIITRIADGSIVFANDLFASLLSMSTDELKHCKATDFYDDPNLYQSLMNELKEKGSILNRELAFHKGDGTILWLLLSLRLTHFRNESVVVAGFQEITEHRQILEELHKAEILRAQLEKEREIVDLKQQFISTVSHEFRTPMTVITTSAEVLERYRERLTIEQQDERLHNIQEQVKQMTNLLNDVLIVSQGQTEQFKFVPEHMNLVSFCSDIADQIQLIATTHQVKFNIIGELEDVVMDAKLLRHILSNLLSNALKYSPDGGKIGFEVRRVGERVNFRISDTGMGIPEAGQARLFEPFYRAKNAHDIQGTGLGLTIVKNSVTTHQGSIEFQSKEGVGTTFIVDLPIV